MIGVARCKDSNTTTHGQVIIPCGVAILCSLFVYHFEGTGGNYLSARLLGIGVSSFCDFSMFTPFDLDNIHLPHLNVNEFIFDILRIGLVTLVEQSEIIMP